MGGRRGDPGSRYQPSWAVEVLRKWQTEAKVFEFGSAAESGAPHPPIVCASQRFDDVLLEPAQRGISIPLMSPASALPASSHSWRKPSGRCRLRHRKRLSMPLHGFRYCPADGGGGRPALLISVNAILAIALALIATESTTGSAISGVASVSAAGAPAAALPLPPLLRDLQVLGGPAPLQQFSPSLCSVLQTGYIFHRFFSAVHLFAYKLILLLVTSGFE